MLYNMNMFVKNTIVRECFYNAIYNSNTVIGYTLALVREKYIDICLSFLSIIVNIRCILKV